MLFVMRKAVYCLTNDVPFAPFLTGYLIMFIEPTLEPSLSSQSSSSVMDGLVSEVLDFEKELNAFIGETSNLDHFVASLGQGKEKMELDQVCAEWVTEPSLSASLALNQYISGYIVFSIIITVFQRET